MPKTIDTAITGPFDLDHASQNPVTITSTGSITSTGAGEDGVDGVAGVAWSIFNDGAVSSAGGYGVDLAGAGSLDNSGTVSGLTSGFVTGGSGSVVNQGTITGTSGDGVSFGHGGSVTNRKAGSITGGTYSLTQKPTREQGAAPSRSCIPAEWTITRSGRPSTSTRACTLRPFTFLPAS
jgi:hypothetical protein